MFYSAEPHYTVCFQVSKLLEFLQSVPSDDADTEMIEAELPKTVDDL